jgi:AcrR family transcriptional regulator
VLGKQSKEVALKTQKKIIRAALKVFAKEGFPDAKLRQIAKEAGTTHSLISHHFGSKEKLWQAVVDYGLTMRETKLKQIIEAGQHLEPVELFKKTIESHILFCARHDKLAKILLHSHSRTGPHIEYVIERQKRVHDLVIPLFKKVQRCGFFTEFDHDSFTVYMRALAEMPVAAFDVSNHLLKHDIRSKEGILLHTQRVITFLFPTENKKENG